MKHKKAYRQGFTLIELVIVIIIIGILASISAPLMARNVAQARRSEAVAALGTIRTAERMYYMEHGTYVSVDSSQWGLGAAAPLGSYIRPSDLNGKYFNSTRYEVNYDSVNAAYGIFCNAAGTGGCAPENLEVVMNENGYIVYGE